MYPLLNYPPLIIDILLIISGKNPDIEPGEEVDELPYKRPSRRGKHGQLLIAQLKAAGIKG